MRGTDKAKLLDELIAIIGDDELRLFYAAVSRAELLRAIEDARATEKQVALRGHLGAKWLEAAFETIGDSS